MAFTALFDACVLYPQYLRDLLMHLAGTDLFRAKWSNEIHEEWIRAVLRDHPHITPERLARTRQLMDDTVLDCLVTGHEALAEHLELPDPGDRHVLAAAIIGRADVIVTRNLRDFPAPILERYNIDVQHPDVFIRHVLDLNEVFCISAIRTLRAAMKSPPMSAAEYLDMLSRQELPETVAFLRPWADTL